LNRSAAILLIFVFAIIWLKPYVPYLDYAINKDYIAKELCENKDNPVMKCDGKCHLAKKIKEQSEEEKEPSKPTNPTKQENDVIPFLIESMETSFSITENVDEAAYKPRSLRTVWTDTSTPPPENLV